MISSEQYQILHDVENGLPPIIVTYDFDMHWDDIKEYLQEYEDEHGEKTVLSTKGKQAVEEYRRQKRRELHNTLSLIFSGIALIVSIIAIII